MRQGVVRVLLVWEYKLQLKLAAYLNWRAGYAFSAVKRCRECGHTAHQHYPNCGAVWNRFWA